MSIIAQMSKMDDINKDYSSEKYTYPQHENVPPEIKQTKGYCLDICRYAYSMLIRDKTAIPVNWYSYIQVLRDYMSGSQSKTFYDNMLRRYDNSGLLSGQATANGAESARKGVENISSRIASIATNLMNAIHGMYDEYEEDIYVNSIDNESGAEEEKAMFEAMFEAKMAPISNLIEKNYNIPVGSSSNIPQDVTLEEMQIYKDTGGFKTYWAESMEEALKHTFHISKWDKIIRRKLLNDGVAINFMAARSIYCKKTKKEKIEYMDPANTYIQHSTENMFDDAEYAGYLTLEKVGTLTEKGFDSEDLMKAAWKYRDYLDNPYIDDWGEDSQTRSPMDSRIRDIKVPVFHHYWIDVDEYQNKKITNKFGVFKIHKKDINAKIEDLSEERVAEGYTQEVYKTRLKQVYQCSWIVDTDLAYDYGRVINQVKKDREVELPVKVWRGECTNPRMVFGSIAESIVPFLDHLQLAWEKYQDAMSKYHPGGYKINFRLLSNLSIDGEKLQPYEAYEMFWNTNVMPYMDTPIGENYSGGDVSPISRIEGSGTEGLVFFQNEIRFVAEMIERVTGINPVTMGRTEQGITATATSIASVGTQNVLRPIINGIFEVKEKLGTYASMRIPLLFRNIKGTEEVYSKIIGKESVQVIKDAESIGAEYGLTMEARPSDEDVRDLNEMINVAIQRGRDGEASINLGQAMYIKERIKSGGNFKKLQRQVEFMIRKQEAEIFEKKRILIQEQSQQQAAQSQAASEAEMKNKLMDAKISEESKDKDLKRSMMLADHAHELKMEEILTTKAIEQDAEED